MIRLNTVLNGSYSTRMEVECCRLLQDFILEQAIECTLVKFTENTRGVASKHLEVELPFKRTYQGAWEWSDRNAGNFHDGKKAQLLVQEGRAPAGFWGGDWGAGGSSFVVELWRCCQAGSQQPSGSITLWGVGWGKQHTALLSTYWITLRCCVQLWASCSGNGNWSKFRVSSQLRFARWSQALHSDPWWEGKRCQVQTARGELQAGQKERCIHGGKSQAVEQLPGERGFALCPQRFSRPGHTKPTTTCWHLALD